MDAPAETKNSPDVIGWVIAAMLVVAAVGAAWLFVTHFSVTLSYAWKILCGAAAACGIYTRSRDRFKEFCGKPWINNVWTRLVTLILTIAVMTAFVWFLGDVGVFGAALILTLRLFMEQPRAAKQAVA